MTRIAIPDFQLPNPLYGNSIVTFFTVDASGVVTTTKATLYDAATGSGTLSNPVRLDADGTFATIPYIDAAVIGSITDARVADHSTGIIEAMGSFRGDWATATVYFPGDLVRDGANGDDTKDIFFVQGRHTSGTWATDSADATILVQFLDVAAIAALGDTPATALLAANNLSDVAAAATAFTNIKQAASTTATGVAELSTDAEAITGTDTGRVITPANLKAVTRTLPGAKNLIINGGFQVNQRGYVSGTATADGTYMHDRWRSGTADSSYTFSTAYPASPQTVTIAANDSIEQVIEGANIDTAGTHTISWEGTATARAVVNTQTMSGNFAVSPITVVAVLDQVITIQFTGANAAGGSTIATDTGTLGKAQCELGAVATTFEKEDIGATLAKCQRYAYVIIADSGSQFGTGYLQAATDARITINHPVTMRATPTVSVSAGADFRIVSAGGNTEATAVAGNASTRFSTGLSVTCGALTAGQGCKLHDDTGGNAVLTLDAEL